MSPIYLATLCMAVDILFFPSSPVPSLGEFPDSRSSLKINLADGSAQFTKVRGTLSNINLDGKLASAKQVPRLQKEYERVKLNRETIKCNQ
jgi:hypothetical protein